MSKDVLGVNSTDGFTGVCPTPGGIMEVDSSVLQ